MNDNSVPERQQGTCLRRCRQFQPPTVSHRLSALWICLGDAEYVRGVYVAVRDDVWRAIGSVVERLIVADRDDSFEIEFDMRHREAEIDFRWSGRISGDRRGTVRFTTDGIAGATFRSNRIGFCVLHPMELAGVPVAVETGGGLVEGSFPERISPWQPFTDFTALRWPIRPGFSAVLRLEGGLFEMEDQRNWTDASYKTYCPPLRAPYPVQLDKGGVDSPSGYAPPGT